LSVEYTLEAAYRGWCIGQWLDFFPSDVSGSIPSIAFFDEVAETAGATLNSWRSSSKVWTVQLTQLRESRSSWWYVVSNLLDGLPFLKHRGSGIVVFVLRGWKSWPRDSSMFVAGRASQSIISLL
jgi:hypothetical protein